MHCHETQRGWERRERSGSHEGRECVQAAQERPPTFTIRLGRSADCSPGPISGASKWETEAKRGGVREGMARSRRESEAELEREEDEYKRFAENPLRRRLGWLNPYIGVRAQASLTPAELRATFNALRLDSDCARSACVRNERVAQMFREAGCTELPPEICLPGYTHFRAFCELCMRQFQHFNLASLAARSINRKAKLALLHQQQYDELAHPLLGSNEAESPMYRSAYLSSPRPGSSASLALQQRCTDSQRVASTHTQQHGRLDKQMRAFERTRTRIASMDAVMYSPETPLVRPLHLAETPAASKLSEAKRRHSSNEQQHLPAKPREPYCGQSFLASWRGSTPEPESKQPHIGRPVSTFAFKLPPQNTRRAETASPTLQPNRPQSNLAEVVMEANELASRNPRYGLRREVQSALAHYPPD